MEKRIDLEKRGRDASEIFELNLDNCRSTAIVGLTDEFVNLEILSLMNVGLTSLKGFPKLPNLKKLELSKNRISNGLNVLHSCPKLTTLNLGANKINDLETLEPLKELKNLKRLDISNTEAASIDSYREKVFNLIPQLKYLDGYDAEDQASASDDSEGEEASVDGEDGIKQKRYREDDEYFDDEDESDEAEEEDEDELGLETVYKDNLDEESEGDDYDGEGEGDDDEDGVEEDGVEEEESDNEVEDSKEESIVRGKKRKHADEDEGE